MSNGFNRSQLDADVEAVFGFIKKFIASFLKKPKKIGSVEIGWAEEQKTRFMLNLVEMGISKIIRTIIISLVALFIFLPLFLKSQWDMRGVLFVIFLFFFVWMMQDHLLVDKKPAGFTAGWILKIHAFFQGVLKKITSLFSKG